jgi:Helitron helicase-like domain at N-terminus
LHGLALDALATVAQCGAPSFFTTLTCNPKWREIQERLHIGQTAYDRPDIVVRVFREKLRRFIHNLKLGCYHGNKVVDGKFVNGKKGQMVYIMHVIEYQHRGLPHAHIVYRLIDAPDKVLKDDSPEVVTEKQNNHIKYIDGYIDDDNVEHLPEIVAYRPGKIKGNNLTPDQEAQNIYDDLIGETQIHTCAVGVNACKQKETDFCKRRFDRFSVSESTTFNKDGYPEYRRPNVCDLKVVGHNRCMLLDWRGHVNVEFATSVKSCLYLYSYLYKGCKKDYVIATEENAEDEKESEEMIYLNGRFLCAMDAMGRALGFPTYPKQEPSTVSVSIKLKKQVEYYLGERKITDMTVYMLSRTIPVLEKFTIQEFFKTYYYSTKRPNTERKIEGVDYFILTYGRNECYLKKYVRNDLRVVRLEMVYPEAGELYYLRVILKNRAINRGGWDDTYRSPPKGEPHSVLYTTYQAAARAAGYLGGEFCI